MAATSESEAQIGPILEAASTHNNTTLQKLLDQYSFADCSSVDVIDPKTGRCPLHCAILSCVPSNGESDVRNVGASLENAGCETVRLLLENGAIWNQLDKQDETPGCLARRLGLLDLYQLMVDAGVRAEMLLNRLEGYEPLDDDDELDEVDEDEAPQLVSATDEHDATTTTTDTSTHGTLAESIDVDNPTYLSSVLSFDEDKLLDDQNNGVMMEWERSIMKKSAEAIVNQPGLKVLNIGAGMLIFDSIVQGLDAKPTEHHIVEAHPDVLAEMKAKGWLEKPGVTVHAGKWQDVLPTLVANGNTFDAIYFDTFAESYADFKDFFSEQVIGLLDEAGNWSFFNGMGADRQISYDVYQKVVEMDLFEAGFDIEWQEMDVPVLDQEWEGVKRKYWNISTYRLPVCSFMG